MPEQRDEHVAARGRDDLTAKLREALEVAADLLAEAGYSTDPDYVQEWLTIRDALAPELPAAQDRGPGHVSGEPAGGTCEVCGNPPKTRALAQDHDHKTGKQRGKLCFVCNRYILGKYATPAKLRAAADYLERYA